MTERPIGSFGARIDGSATEPLAMVGPTRDAAPLSPRLIPSAPNQANPCFHPSPPITNPRASVFSAAAIARHYPATGAARPRSYGSATRRMDAHRSSWSSTTRWRSCLPPSASIWNPPIRARFHSEAQPAARWRGRADIRLVRQVLLENASSRRHATPGTDTMHGIRRVTFGRSRPLKRTEPKTSCLISGWEVFESPRRECWIRIHLRLDRATDRLGSSLPAAARVFDEEKVQCGGFPRPSRTARHVLESSPLHRTQSPEDGFR